MEILDAIVLFWYMMLIIIIPHTYAYLLYHKETHHSGMDIEQQRRPNMAIHKVVDGYLHSIDVLVAKQVFTRKQADEQIDEIINLIIDKRVENENKDIKIQIKETEK